MLCQHLNTGWSGEKIVVGGDSGGGNLSVALALKCIHLGVRPPDGIFVAYAPLNLQLTPSPSRLLCAVDSLIPLEFLLHCLHSEYPTLLLWWMSVMIDPFGVDTIAFFFKLLFIFIFLLFKLVTINTGYIIFLAC